MILILSIVNWVLRIWEYVIFAWVLMSWLPGAQQSSLGQFLGKISSVIVDPIRKIMPRIGMLDFSPLVALLLLQAAQMGLVAVSQVFY